MASFQVKVRSKIALSLPLTFVVLSCLRLSANQNCALLALREMIVKMQVVFLYLLYLYATTFPLSVLSFTFPCAYFFVCISVAGFSSAKSTDD